MAAKRVQSITSKLTKKGLLGCEGLAQEDPFIGFHLIDKPLFGDRLRNPFSLCALTIVQLCAMRWTGYAPSFRSFEVAD